MRDDPPVPDGKRWKKEKRMYSRILVPLDGGELAKRAVQPAEEIAQATKAEIILFEVVQNPIRSAPIAAGQTEVTKATQDVTGKGGAYLQKIADALKAKGIKVRCEIEVGEPTGRILKKAHNEEVDLIVMSTHYEGELHKLVTGSIAEKVLLGTKRPVLLVKPERVAIAHHVDEQEVFGKKAG
ncbi:MAG: universal stress protein [candidate division NC10 bacterium]|nr:universal stress protein [candidate division NC10 bacterium]